MHTGFRLRQIVHIITNTQAFDLTYYPSFSRTVLVPNGPILVDRLLTRVSNDHFYYGETKLLIGTMPPNRALAHGNLYVRGITTKAEVKAFKPSRYSKLLLNMRQTIEQTCLQAFSWTSWANVENVSIWCECTQSRLQQNDYNFFQI